MAIRATNKKPLFGNNRPNCLKATRKKQNLNMQKVTVNGTTFLTTAREAKRVRRNINNQD